MTPQEFQQCLAYLNVRKNTVWIEAEMRHKDKVRFDTKYNSYTGLAVPANSSTLPYYVWSASVKTRGKVIIYL